MNDATGYVVYFFPPALEALGDAIKPYLQEGPTGPHVACREVDTGGAFIEMTLEGRSDDGQLVLLELMVPGNMVRMIVSARNDSEFGFYDRNRPAPAMLEPGLAAMPDADAAAAASPPSVDADEAKPGA
jgi:hypothetical protein